MDRIVPYLIPGLLILGLGYLTFYLLRDMLEPVSWAVILVYSTWPLHIRLVQALNGRNGLGAALMVLLLSSLLIIPFIGLTAILQRELVEFFNYLPGWLEKKPAVPDWVLRIPFLGEELRFVFDQFNDFQGLARQYLMPRLSGISVRFLGMVEGAGFIAAKLTLALFLMFFFYRDGRQIVAEVRQGLVLALGERAHAYLATAETTIRAVVYGIVLTAIVQGGFAGLGYWGAGVRAPVLLSLFTIFFGLVPFGVLVVWVSASLWLIAGGEHWAGIFLFAWGSLVVSWVDNLVRPLVISRTTRIPFVLVMLGVLGGLTSFGFIGLFIGPVILAIGLAVWREWVHSSAGAEPGE
jgi:predicted PurR-regulated permease PerM